MKLEDNEESETEGGRASHEKEMEMSLASNEICERLKRCIEIREKYISQSLQGQNDNPKDSDEWEIEPPMVEDLFRSDSELTALAPRNVGKLTNSTFDLAKCKVPIDDLNSIYKFDSDGIFKVYDLKETKTKSSVDDKDHENQENPESGEKKSGLLKTSVASVKEYFQDLDYISSVVNDGPIKSFAFKRLKILDSQFELYILGNDQEETKAQKKVPHRDFYNVRKVDTHVHHSSSMNSKHLLRFIKSKLKKSPKDVVIYRDEKYLTLEQVFESLNLTAYELSIDTLDMHAHKDSFHRFDNFNNRYNPLGETRLREIFLKTDNLIHGRYLSELTREVISDLEASKYQMAEYRISIYGRSRDEFEKLANWVYDNQIFSKNVRWLIQIPRLYQVYKTKNHLKNFSELIENIFAPLFESTRNPSKNPKLHLFLKNIVGFDCVDDESKIEKRIHKKFPLPNEWDLDSNPPYSYWIYYLYANITSLNQYRKERGMNLFVLRPHSGEAGDPDHLTSAFVTCHSISHGIMLRKVPALQYLFYLMQIGIAMSPLSNNALFLTFERSPFPQFFKRGLNVSLSTDDPLQFHYTREPLIEEYSVAAQIWKLSSADLCEISKNSVLQSGFELSLKKKWLGNNCTMSGPEGNDISKTNVPDIRVKYRNDTLKGEWSLLYSGGVLKTCSGLVQYSSALNSFYS